MLKDLANKISTIKYTLRQLLQHYNLFIYCIYLIKNFG